MAAFAAVIAVATIVLDIGVRSTWENSLRSNLQRSLVQEAEGFSLLIQNDHNHTLQQIAEEQARITETRATIIAHDGKVLADSKADPETMENHATRPEIALALTGKVGASTRLSHTVGIEFLYVAVPSGDKIARLAFP